jgi:hypothetical protein
MEISTMWFSRPALAAVLIAATGMPAFAHPIEIATLGRAPLLGQSTNVSELRYNVRTHESRVRRAAYDLGLTRGQYEEFRRALDSKHPNWVTIPRHLDAMTWQSGGQVHVVHDVIIPPNQKGVEVDLTSGDRIVSVFMPAACGNLSVIRRPVPHVAAVHNFPVPHPRPVAAAPEPAATTAPEVAVAPAAVLVPEAAAPPIVAPATHARVPLFPLLALIPALFSGGGGSSPIAAPIVNAVGGGGGDGGGGVVAPPPCPNGTSQ